MSSKARVSFLVTILSILSTFVFQGLTRGFAQSPPAESTSPAQDTLKSELTGRLGEIRLFRSESDDSPLKNLVFMAQGEMFCIHPHDNALDSFDPNIYHHADFNLPLEALPLTVTARLAKPGSLTLVVGGHLVYQCKLLFVPGVEWKVTEEIPFDYSDKAKKSRRTLRPGTYRLGRFGVPDVVN